MSRTLVVLVVLLLVAMGGSAWASASLLGPTGLILTPTAESLGTAQFNLGASAFFFEGADENAIYGNAGLISGLEVGATRVKVEDVDAETLLNAKLRLPQPLPVGLSLAVGVIDITDQVDSTPYLVASHTIGAGLIPPVGPLSNPQVHLGIASGIIDGLFGGVSVNYDRTQLMAEYDGDNVNFGARFPLLDKLELQAAALDGFDDFAVGLTFTSPW